MLPTPLVLGTAVDAAAGGFLAVEAAAESGLGFGIANLLQEASRGWW